MKTSSTCYKVRVANPSDVEAVVELALKAASESPLFIGVQIDNDILTNSISYYIDTGATIVVEDDGSLVGLILADVGQLWYSQEVVVNEMLFYITPEYRGGSISIKLVKYFIDNAKKFNPTKITIGGGLHPAYYKKLEGFYNRLGFVLEGFTMKLGE